jgi:hypothetical protein
MTELSPQAIKLAQVCDQVCDVGEEIVVHVHDHAVALCVQANDALHATIRTANAASQAQRQQAFSILQRNAFAATVAPHSTICGGCTLLV